MARPLTVPIERTAPPESLEIRPRKLRAWLETLPLTNSLECARRACDHLHALNRAKLDLDLRLDLLDAHRAFADALLEDLDAVCARSGLPLSPRARCALALGQELASEIALGYRIAAAESRGKILAFGAKRQVLVHLFRSMQYLGVAMHASYQSHSPAPRGLWRSMHEIFLHAEDEGIAHQSVEAESKRSIADLYCEWLLVALADPYHLARGEIDRILAQLRHARIALQLARSCPATPRGAHFVVDCESDDPPRPAREADGSLARGPWRILDANALVEALRARRMALSNDGLSAAARKAHGADAQALLEKLISLWGDRPQRSAERRRVDSRVGVCVGLNAITRWIAGDASAAVTPSVNEWYVLDQSARGLKVRRTDPHAYPVAVGEVVAIEWGDKAERTIGVVRWVMMTEEGGLEAGLQLLGEVARSVWLQPRNPEDTEFRLALVLDSGAPPERAEALLAPPGTYGDDRRLEVDDEGLVAPIRPTRLVERTGRFELFHFCACEGGSGAGE